MTNCTNCGKELNEGATFCDKCGTPVQPAQPVQQAQPVPTQPVPQQPMQQPVPQQPMPPQPYGQPPYPQQGAYAPRSGGKTALIIILIAVGVIGIALAIILPIALSGGGKNTSGGGNNNDNNNDNNYYYDENDYDFGNYDDYQFDFDY